MKVTVVIPSYNHKPYVEQAIHSVLQQSYRDVELIVIDDGSSDGSKELIAELHRQNPGFRFVSRENQGLVSTLRQGLEMATGDYFCELASDDFLPSDNLVKRVSFLNQHPDVVSVFTDGINVDRNGKEINLITKEKIKDLYRSDNPIPDIINNVTPVFSTGLIRTRALRECGGFDASTFRFYEDIDTPVRLCGMGKFGYIDECLFYRRIHSTNVSGTTTHIRREKILFYQKMLDYPGMEPYRSLLRNRMRRGGIALGRTLAKAHQINELDYQIFYQVLRKFPLDLRLRWYGFKLRQKYRQELVAKACLIHD
ncbi:MAG: glycosyltransferase [Cellvibrionaceae bacterium]